ncbi:MAG: aldo/keto reductase [Alphaproteobacteria bacterium]|nr:aldo/keto reductase [Alphaproteobacteria bacterium]
MMQLTRRQLGLGAAAAGLFGSRAMAQTTAPSVKLPDGAQVPALGQGSWHLAQGRHPAAEEEEALRVGISLGLTLIDTAEIYGGGRAEQMIGRVIAGQRDKVFLVSKVRPDHATASGIQQACAASLSRLGTDHLDLYLLHWRNGAPDLGTVVAGFEALRAEGRTRRWGVSNFGVSDMEDLFRIRGGDACAANQVRYNLDDRGIERDLLPWCERHGVPIMAYSPLGQGGALLRNAALAGVAARHKVTPAAVALAWTMRSGHAISIPEAGSPNHVRENAAALSLRLTDQDVSELARGFT